METKSCSKIIYKKIDLVEQQTKFEETKNQNFKINSCVDDNFSNNEPYLNKNFLEEESLLNSFFEDTKKKPIEITQQMENIIENSKTVENMHLLSDYFNDNFFSNKLNENKDKLEDIYQLTNDKKLNLLSDDVNTDSFEQNLINKNFISTNDIYSMNQINSNTVDTTQLHSSMQFHLQQNSNLKTNSYKNSNLYLTKFDNSIQCNQTNLFNNFHSSQTSNFNNDLLSPQLQTNIETTDQLTNDLNLSMNNQPNYQLNKQNRKKFKNMNNHQKKKTIKFHEYKGPSSQQKSLNKDNLDNSDDRFREQQICLQKQLLNQINNPSKTSKSSSTMNSCFMLNNSNKPVHLNTSQKDLNPKIETNFSDSNKNSESKNSQTDLSLSDEKQINYLDSSYDQNIYCNNYPTKIEENEDFDKINKKNNSKESKEQFNPISPQLTPPYHQPNTFTKIVSDSLPVPLNELKIEKLEDFKVQDLKIYLKKCNLPVSGSKMSLVERLKNYLLRTNPSIKSSINNIQQLTPPNTPMGSDHHNSDSNDGKNSLINQKINPANNCTYNGTKFFVNNNNISHFQASIPLNGYTVQQNQSQFQFQNSSLISNSISQANKLTNSNNSSFTLPIASIQPSQIHFLSNSIISNPVNGNQQFSTNLTVQPQMTTIAQATTINCAPTTIGTLPTIVTPQFTPILFYPRTSSNTTSTNSYNQTACIQDSNAVQQIESNSPIKSSIKSSIRKNILLKQQKQLQQQQMHLQQLQQNEKNVIKNKISDLNDDMKICSKSSNKNSNKMPKVTKVEKNYSENDESSYLKTKDFGDEKKNLSNTTDNDSSNNLNNVFELLMEVEELADFMNANKDVNISDNKQNSLTKLDEKVVEDKVNFGSNDYSNMDSILNNYQLNFNEELENENNFTDWLNNDESLIVNSIYDDDKNFSNNYKKDDLKIDEEMKLVSDLEFNYQNDLINNKSVSYFNSNSMDPIMPNFCIDQNLPNFYLDDNDLTFKSTPNDFDVNCDKTNFTAY